MIQQPQARKIIRKSNLTEILILAFGVINFILIAFILIFVSTTSHDVLICPQTAAECIYD